MYNLIEDISTGLFKHSFSEESFSLVTAGHSKGACKLSPSSRF